MSVAPPRKKTQQTSPQPQQSSPQSEFYRSDPPSKSYVNLTSSALAGVFGSQVSLAELTGDTAAASGSLSSFESGSLTARSQTYPSARSETQSSRSAARPYNHRASLPSLLSNKSVVRLSFATLFPRLVALFLFGVAYGHLAKNLKDNHLVTLETLNIVISRNPIYFSLVWGFQGILLGFLLPLFDWVFPRDGLDSGKGGADWSSIIRAIAAFLGIAYGVRKLTWESSMQAAALWGLVNPFLWYMLDGTKNGFILSSLVAIVGTSFFAYLFPSHLPQLSSLNYISVTVWIASAYYISSICFGNLGRRLLTFGVDAK